MNLIKMVETNDKKELVLIELSKPKPNLPTSFTNLKKVDGMVKLLVQSFINH